MNDPVHYNLDRLKGAICSSILLGLGLGLHLLLALSSVASHNWESAVTNWNEVSSGSRWWCLRVTCTGTIIVENGPGHPFSNVSLVWWWWRLVGWWGVINRNILETRFLVVVVFPRHFGCWDILRTGQSLRCAGWVQMRRNTSIYNWLTYMRLQNAPSCPCWLEKI